MACIVKNIILKYIFKEMQFVAFFIFHMGKTWMQVKNDLRCLRQITLYVSIMRRWWVRSSRRAHNLPQDTDVRNEWVYVITSTYIRVHPLSVNSINFKSICHQFYPAHTTTYILANV